MCGLLLKLLIVELTVSPRWSTVEVFQGVHHAAVIIIIIIAAAAASGDIFPRPVLFLFLCRFLLLLVDMKSSAVSSFDIIVLVFPELSFVESIEEGGA